MEQDLEIKALKFFLLGGGPVGKTAICYSFAVIDFFNDFRVNNEDNFVKIIKLKNNKDIKITLLDTSGQERFMSVAFKFAKSAHVIRYSGFWCYFEKQFWKNLLLVKWSKRRIIKSFYCIVLK